MNSVTDFAEKRAELFFIPPAPPPSIRQAIHWCVVECSKTLQAGLIAIGPACYGTRELHEEDGGRDEMLRSMKDAQRNALLERAWKVMRRAGLSDTTIAPGVANP